MRAAVYAVMVVLVGQAALVHADPAYGACKDFADQSAAQAKHGVRVGWLSDGLGSPDAETSASCAAVLSSRSRQVETAASGSACVRPRSVQRIAFSRRKYPAIRRHYVAATRRGWPRILVLNRRGADARRDRLMEGYPTRKGYDRDEYPPAVGRGRGRGLERGRNPRGWKADVRYLRSKENRSHGSSMGNQLREFCNGTRFRYLFR